MLLLDDVYELEIKNFNNYSNARSEYEIRRFNLFLNFSITYTVNYYL